MAYDKIIAIRSRLDHCVSYALNSEKTDLDVALQYIEDADKTAGEHRIFATALNCTLDGAFAQMQQTKQRWSKPGGVLGYHIIHSYAPGEITPEQAHEIGVEFATALLGGNYEAVVTTHLDRMHLHCHIVFNSVSIIDGKKYRSTKQSYYNTVRRISNEISRRHGLSVIEPSDGGVPYAQWSAERQGKPTVRDVLRKDIDNAITQAFTFRTFLSILRKWGYEIKYGSAVRHTAVRPPGGARFVRLDSLGDGYTEAEIIRRLKEGRNGETQGRQPQGAIFLPQRKYRYVKKPVQAFRHKPRSLRGLYLYYLHLLGKDGFDKTPPPFSVRKEVIRLEHYQAQFRFLREYRIDTADQLDTLHSAIQAEIDALTDDRKDFYRQKRRGADAAEDITALTAALGTWRKKLRLCAQIEAELPRLHSQVGEVRLTENAPKAQEQQKQTKQKFRLGK